MKNIYKILIPAVTLLVVIAACTKVPDLPFYEEGTAVQLTASKTAVTATPTDSLNQVISFNWTNPNYASDSSTFKYILEIDSAGRDFSMESIKIVVGGSGTSLTGKELNNILLNFGFTPGVPVTLNFRVTSSYGNNNEGYKSNVVTVTITPYNDPSVLTTSNTAVTVALNTASQLSNTFTWTRSFNGYSGTVTYSIQYDSAGQGFVTPQEIAVGVDMYKKDLNEGEMNETALNSGIPGGNSGTVEYRVKAVTAQGAVSYSNAVMITIQSYLPLLRFYLPGGYQGATGNGNDWDPPTAPEFIRDQRGGALNRLYYMYIWLPAGAEFKITQGRSWDVNYGGSGGDLSSTGGNLTVANDGFYRISIDRVNLKYDIREGRMGFVGNAVGADWNPSNVFPNYAMGNAGTNLFVGLNDFVPNGWKMIDNDQWNDGSMTVSETRSWGSNGGSGSSLEANGPNMPDITSAGRYRVIWDGRNRDDVKYEMSPATEMRVVGDGMQGVNAWDPSTSPQMTYAGNGVWTATLTLIAGKDIKFLAGNDWGAFDYEDNSGGSTATGTARKIKWEGGDNFKTPTTTGSYTITLDEHNQTVTIN